MAKKVVAPLLWMLSGMALMGFIVTLIIPSLIRIEQHSPLIYEETIAVIQEAIEQKHDWKVPQVFNLQNNIQTAERSSINQVDSVAQCRSLYTFSIQDDEQNRNVTVFMPLGIGVYEEEETGQVHITQLNVALLGMIFGGAIADVMSDANMDVKDIISRVTNNSRIEDSVSSR